MSDKRPHHLIRQARGALARATGHRYLHLERACESMGPDALQDIIHIIHIIALIHNMESRVTTERNKRRRGQFW